MKENAQLVLELIQTLEALLINPSTSLCRHSDEPIDILGRCKGTWSVKVEADAKAMLAKARRDVRV